MRFDVVTLFPGMFRAVTDYGITGRAVRAGLLQVETWNPRDFTRDRHRTVDDRPYGGGPGMVMRFEPVREAILAARKAAPEEAAVIHVSPQGQRLDQEVLANLAGKQRLILLSGRYEGIDERLIELEVDQELSVGDYVLSGGELAAMVIIDGVTRLLPGALGDGESARQDSFASGLLDYPHYTRPKEVVGKAVPKVLLSGDHGAIARWREKQALGRTWSRRPELLKRYVLNDRQRALLEEYIAEQGRETEDSIIAISGENDEQHH